METGETRRVWIFIAFAFGIAWSIDLMIYLTEGLSNLGVGSRAWILLAVSMTAPSVANILTRLLTGEGWRDLYLWPHFRQSWPFWLIAWLGTPLLVLMGTVLFFALFPQYLDPTLSPVQALLNQTAKSTGRTIPVGPMAFLVLQIGQAILVAPLVNGLGALGEELGWRAYLLPKLVPYGWRKAALLTGVIWGIWHWPVIAMGYNYGASYPGAPWTGMLAMVWFTAMMGVSLAWLALNAESVWPAVMGHAALNGWAALHTLLVLGQPDPLLGPVAVGLVSSLPFALLALWLLWQWPELRRHPSASEQQWPQIHGSSQILDVQGK
jgi:membrane protease YdiL (CAAX protease family)